MCVIEKFVCIVICVSGRSEVVLTIPSLQTIDISDIFVVEKPSRVVDSKVICSELYKINSRVHAKNATFLYSKCEILHFFIKMVVTIINYKIVFL